MWLGHIQGDEHLAEHSLTCATNPPKPLDEPTNLGWGRGCGPALRRNVLMSFWEEHEVEVR